MGQYSEYCQHCKFAEPTEKTDEILCTNSGSIYYGCIINNNVLTTYCKDNMSKEYED